MADHERRKRIPPNHMKKHIMQLSWHHFLFQLNAWPHAWLHRISKATRLSHSKTLLSMVMAPFVAEAKRIQRRMQWFSLSLQAEHCWQYLIAKKVGVFVCVQELVPSLLVYPARAAGRIPPNYLCASSALPTVGTSDASSTRTR